jgi:hypothetical protein
VVLNVNRVVENASPVAEVHDKRNRNNTTRDNSHLGELPLVVLILSVLGLRKQRLSISTAVFYQKYVRLRRAKKGEPGVK